MADSNELYRIILRHDTSTNWTLNNPTLYLGEYGIEDDTHKVKRGDGESTWEELEYENFGILDMINASKVVYDNSDTQLTSTDVQSAITELYNKLKD